MWLRMGFLRLAMSELRDEPPTVGGVRGVFETVVYAADVPGAVAFYEDVLGLRVLRPVSGPFAVFRVASESMLLVVDPAYSRQTGRAAPHHGAIGPGHFALRIDEASAEAWKSRLIAKGVAIEKEIRWPPGGRSIYFRDPAGNSVELAAGDVWGAQVE